MKRLMFALLLVFSVVVQAAPRESVATLSAVDASGKPHALSDPGHVVLIDFWASWCGPCRQSFPWMNAMQAKYGKDGLHVIAVNLDASRADAEVFLQAMPAQFDVLYDPEGRVADAIGVSGMPMSFLVDREGRVRHRMSGFSEARKPGHEALIQAMLRGE